MRTARWIELLSGLAAGIVGLLTLASLLFGPTSQYIKSVTTCTGGPNSVSCTSTGLDHITSGPIRIDLFPLSVFLLSVLALLFGTIAVSAALHSRFGHALWLACLWASTGLLVSLLLLTLPNLALVLLPAQALAVVASGTAWIAAQLQVERNHRQRGVVWWMEALGGVSASLFGFAASAYLLTAPNQWMSSSSSCNVQGVCQEITTGSPSPLLADPVGTLLLAIMPLAFFGLLAFSAVRHSRTGAPVWRAWLWGISLLLVGLSILGMFSIGLFFLPSAWLSLLAAICSFGPAHTAKVLRQGL